MSATNLSGKDEFTALAERSQYLKQQLNGDHVDFGSTEAKNKAFDNAVEKLEKEFWNARLSSESYYEFLRLRLRLVLWAVHCYGSERLGRWISLSWWAREMARSVGLDAELVDAYRLKAKIVLESIEMDSQIGKLQDALRFGQMNDRLLAGVREMATRMVENPDAYRRVQFARLGEAMHLIEAARRLKSLGLTKESIKQLKRRSQDGEYE